jgi:hypothetical protein
MELKTLPLRGFPRAAHLQAGTRETRSFSAPMRQEERKTIAEEKRARAHNQMRKRETSRSIDPGRFSKRQPVDSIERRELDKTSRPGN